MAEIHGLFYIRGYFHHEKLGWFLPSSHQKKRPYIHIPLHWGDQVIHLGPWGWSSWLPAGSGMPEIGQVPFGCSSRIAATVTGLFDAVQGIGGALAWCNHPGPIQRISVTYFFGGVGEETGVIGCGLARKEILDFWGQESEIGGGGGGGLFIVVCALLCFLIAGWVRIACYYCSFLVQRWNDVIIGETRHVPWMNH